MKVFVLLDYYIPGYKSGGPIRTIANMVDLLGDKIEFWILTRDRDKPDTTSYSDIVVGAWNPVGKAQVFYAPPKYLTLANIRKLILEVSPDVVYLNSFFSPFNIKFLMLRRLGLVPAMPVIMAPRGQFSGGALTLKSSKKKFFLSLALRLGLYRRLLWQASSLMEKADIERVLGSNRTIHVTPNAPASASSVLIQEAGIKRDIKQPGSVRLVFLSRIVPMKNLQYALDVLVGLPGSVLLDIYGPPEDSAYWQKCQETIATMPSNIKVNYCGPVPHEQVAGVLSKYHFLLLPTQGENFGHIILEAMSVGCPVIISDRTPWQDLEAKGVGWSTPLENPELWKNVLEQCIDMSESTYQNLSDSTRRFALNWALDPQVESQNMSLFEAAMKSTGRAMAVK